MYRRIFMLLVACVLSLSLISCASADTANSTQDVSSNQATPESKALYNYIMENLGYTITDLRIVSENEGYHIVLNALGTPDMLQKLCEDSLKCINGYSTEHSISISKINPIIISSDNTAFGWSTNGTLYSTDTYPIAEDVAISDIASKLSENVAMDSYYMPDIKDIAPIADEDIQWEIISTQDYIRENKECIGYRVYINTNKASDLQYRSIFKEITDKDGKYLHTIWFYFSESAADGSEEADVTMEQIAEGIIPLPKSN